MYYKPDWPLARKRIEAFWKNQIIDRCCLAVLSPRNSITARPLLHWPHAPDSAHCTDPEENYKIQIARFESTYFGGEALPCTYINWPVPNDLKQVISIIRYFLEKSKGDFFVAAAEHGSAGDILSLSRGGGKIQYRFD